MRKGFTLAELLIALAILGVIATFTIPKVLTSQTDTKYKAAAKEVAGAISGAYEAYKKNATPTANTKPLDLSPFLNYVRVDTASTIDADYTMNSVTCSTTTPCLVMHNGGTLLIGNDCFAGTGNNHIWFLFDPNGKYSGSPTSSDKAMSFALSFSGRLTDNGGLTNNSQIDYSCDGGPVTEGPDSSFIPPWFNWN